MAKKSIWKGLCGAMVLTLGVCTLAGCGSQEAASGKTVVEMVSYKPEAVEVFGEIAKRFNETHNDIELVIDSPNEAMTILKTRLLGD